MFASSATILDPPRAPVADPPRRPGRGRAAVGALLVVASAVGVVASWGGTDGPAADRYVVAAHDLAPGQVVAGEDLALVAIALPGAQRSRSFTSPDVVVGTVTLNGIRRGELLQSADVTTRPDPNRVELSVGVARTAAMEGDPRFLRAGERVDVLGTSIDGGVASTTRVATDAVVVDVLDSRGRIGGGGDLTVVLAVQRGEAVGVSGAAAAGKIALVRTTGARP
jgi:hypothetical protein